MPLEYPAMQTYTDSLESGFDEIEIKRLGLREVAAKALGIVLAESADDIASNFNSVMRADSEPNRALHILFGGLEPIPANVQLETGAGKSKNSVHLSFTRNGTKFKVLFRPNDPTQCRVTATRIPTKTNLHLNNNEGVLTPLYNYEFTPDKNGEVGDYSKSDTLCFADVVDMLRNPEEFERRLGIQSAIVKWHIRNSINFAAYPEPLAQALTNCDL